MNAADEVTGLYVAALLRPTIRVPRMDELARAIDARAVAGERVKRHDSCHACGLAIDARKRVHRDQSGNLFHGRCRPEGT